MVDAFEVFDDHTFDAQVVAPDPFNEFSIVAALDVDAATPGNPRVLALKGDRTRRRSGRPGRAWRGRAPERYAHAIEQKSPWCQRENPHLAGAVFEPDDVFLAVDDRTTKAVGSIFDDEIAICFDNGDRNALLARVLRRGKNVLWVAIHDWLSSLKILTAREMTSATVTNEIADCSMNIAFAHRDNGSVSVGLNAVALVNDV